MSRQVVMPRNRSGKTLTLTITKKYFDLIRTRAKRVEYRSGAKEYYHKIFDGERRFEYIRLHYRRKPSMTLRIRRVELIAKPDALRQSPFLVGASHIFAIHLGKIVHCRLR